MIPDNFNYLRVKSWEARRTEKRFALQMFSFDKIPQVKKGDYID